MIKKTFSVIIFTLISNLIFAQLNDYSIKYGFQGHLLIPNTEFKNDAYIFSPSARAFLKIEITTSLESEIGFGIANLSGEDNIKSKWESVLIPADFRLNFSPFTSDLYSPYIYAGVGLLRWFVVDLPKYETQKESGWNSFIPIGAGVEFNLNSKVILDISSGYNFIMTDKLNNYSNNKNNDGYFNFGFGFTFVEGGGFTDEDNDGLIQSFEEEIGTNPNLNDTDVDGLSDGDEINKYFTDPLNVDSDFDNLTDFDEIKKYFTDPNSKDTDGDDLIDSDEVLKYLSNPNNKDTDGDGLSDGYEINKFKTDPTTNDSDQDGLLDREEINETKTDPNNKDTDGDGFSDGLEIKTLKTNPLVKDAQKNAVPIKEEETKTAINLIPTSIDSVLNSSELNSDHPMILEGLNFVLESAEIDTNSELILQKTLEILNNNPNLKIEVHGYTDNTGSKKYNLTLSEKRAEAIKEWLVKHGIDFRRVNTIGFGEANPIGDNNTELGREKNRRIEIRKID